MQIAISSKLTSSLIAEKALNITKDRNEEEEGELLSSDACSSPRPGRLARAGDRITEPCDLLSLEGHSSLKRLKKI